MGTKKRSEESIKQHIAYTDVYNKQFCKQYKIKLNTKHEPDLIEWLDNQPNKQGYIKQLIRQDMEQQSID